MEVTKAMLVLSLLPLLASGQARPRTRLELLFNGLMDNMESMASRINAAFFSPSSQESQFRRPQPQRFSQQPIEHFSAVPEVTSNDIAFDPSHPHFDEAPNAPPTDFSPHFSHEFYDPGANPGLQVQQVFPEHQSSLEGPHQQQHFSSNTPQQQYQFRPQHPPRSGGFDLRRFVNRAMNRVRNILPATRRRVVL